MSVPAPPRAPRKPAATARLVGATPALVVTARGTGRTLDSLAPPGQPAGTHAVAVGGDVPGSVQRVRATITETGGTVVTVVDHAADAAAAGVRLPPNTEVIGGALVTALPLLRVSVAQLAADAERPAGLGATVVGRRR